MPTWLRERGVDHVLGPEAEEELVALAAGSDPGDVTTQGVESRRHRGLTPDRAGLPPLSQYAALQMPDGSTRVVGSTDATRGCKHLCRHCPIVPVYNGRFHAIPVDAVLEDVGTQVHAGAQHISFGDPDFLNGPTHARRIVERLATECPGVTYDATIKIEHLLTHASMLPVLAGTGCLFITSAVESIDDRGPAASCQRDTRGPISSGPFSCAATRASRYRRPLSPSPRGRRSRDTRSCCGRLSELALAEQVAPIQLAIRLLITSGSPLLNCPTFRRSSTEFDPASLTWPWRHRDPRVDALQAIGDAIAWARGREAAFERCGPDMSRTQRPP